MYKLGKPIHKHHRRSRLLAIISIVALFSLLIYLLMNLRITPEQNIRNAAPVSKQYKVETKTKINIDKSQVKFELPEGWTEASTLGRVAPLPAYSYRSPSADAQMIDIYIGDLPSTMAVNNVLRVEPQGFGMSYERVSDNCATFTQPNADSARTGATLAKWQDVNFYCDTASVSRQVVGVQSTEGINKITVQGETKKYPVFITYTDNNINPDYSVFYDILSSFHFK